jgi:hypothetical protein
MLVFLTAFATQSPAPEHTARHVTEMHKHPWFWDVLIASIVGWVLGVVKGFTGSADWLKNYWPKVPVLVIFALDLVMFVIVGAYFGTGIYNPENVLEALAAGLSWPIGFGSLATRK